MAAQAQLWCLVLLCLCSVVLGGRTIVQEGGSACDSKNVLKKLTFRSPLLTAEPGVVNNKFFVGQSPKGHIGMKNFVAEIVDENGESVPLTDNYLHHWVMLEGLVPKKHSERHLHHLLKHMKKHHKHTMGYHHSTMLASNEAPGQRKFGGYFPRRFASFFGKGAETRKTHIQLPGPYVRECGKEVEGYENVWILNVHGLDTRGAVDPMGCTECRCNLYNSTTDEAGEPLPEGYIGGLRCCGDNRRCALKEGYNGELKKFYLQYTWEYVDWSDCVIPIEQIGTDITNPDGFGKNLIEFTVDGCGDADPNSEECVDTRVATFIAPKGGDVVLVVSHLHAAITNAILWGEDGRLICETSPIYGEGQEAGNEKNYVVGIRTCIQNPQISNSLRIVEGEKLKYVVTSTKVNGPHTGLMGLVGVELDTNGISAAS